MQDILIHTQQQNETGTSQFLTHDKSVKADLTP